MTTVRDADALTLAEVRWAVEQAARAPSVHNTQPWRFRWDGTSFALFADTERGLTVSDPDGRELVVSCGAALFNLRLALRKLGRRCSVKLLPTPADPRLLALVTMTALAPTTADERRLFAALVRRRTHRGQFEDRPISVDLAVDLQHAAEEEGALLLFVSHPGQRQRVLHLTRAAERFLIADARVREEIAAWSHAPGSTRRDGIPSTAYVSGDNEPWPEDVAPRDFDLGRGFGQVRPAAQPPGAIALLATAGDIENDWLLAGQALERVLVTAAQHHVFATLHSQVIEVPHLREEVRRELVTAAHPQIVLRFGYAQDAATTPRRPSFDILDLT